MRRLYFKPLITSALGTTLYALRTAVVLVSVGMAFSAAQWPLILALIAYFGADTWYHFYSSPIILNDLLEGYLVSD